jgi:hypothetical protein
LTWHKNKNDTQGKKFRPGSAGKPAPEKTYTMEEIKELTQLSFLLLPLGFFICFFGVSTK